MSEKVSPLEDAVRSMARLVWSPFSLAFDEALISAVPEELAKPTQHYLNARIELLMAVKSLLDRRIERLEALRDAAKKKEVSLKKEKVKVE